MQAVRHEQFVKYASLHRIDATHIRRFGVF